MQAILDVENPLRTTNWGRPVAAYGALMAAGAVPTPLYVLYQQREGFGTGMLTVAFAIYVLGVVVALLGLGHVSDRVGRRPVVLTALVAQLAACAVFIASPSLAGLLAGRVVSGLSVGLATGAAAAWIAELHARARPEASPRRAALATTAANLGGIALGPVVAGALAEWAPAPLLTPYVVLAALLLLALAVAALTPETRDRASGPWLKVTRPAAPHGDRAAFTAATLGGLVAFAFYGLANAMVPSFLAGLLHRPSPLLAGAVAGAALGSGAVAQLALHRVGAQGALRVAATALPVGLVTLAAGGWLASLPLFTAGGALAGVGAGMLFQGALATVARLSRPDERAGTMALFFTGAYAGLALPAIGVGVATQFFDPRWCLTVFAALCLTALAAVLRPLARGRRSPHTTGSTPPALGRSERSPLGSAGPDALRRNNRSGHR